MREDVAADWARANGHQSEIEAILRQPDLLGRVVSRVSVETANEHEDLHHATDYVFQASGGGTVAARIRFDITQRDWTIRSARASGIETELAKLRAGWADWYLYGWVEGGKIVEWMFLDLRLVREKGILQMDWQEITNRDGQSSFIPIPRHRLRDLGVIAVERCVPTSGEQRAAVRGRQLALWYI